jgi:hypothetical protein
MVRKLPTQKRRHNATAAGRSTSAAGAVIVGRGEGDTAALELATGVGPEGLEPLHLGVQR